MLTLNAFLAELTKSKMTPRLVGERVVIDKLPRALLPELVTHGPSIARVLKSPTVQAALKFGTLRRIGDAETCGPGNLP